MAPKEAYKVHSLSQHVANTNKGISAEQQFNHKPTTLGAVKKNPQNPNAVFGNNDDSDDDDSSSESESESDAEDTTGFLQKINNKRQTASAAPKPKDKADAKAKTNGQAKSAETASSSSSEAESSDEESDANDKKKTGAKVAKEDSSSEEESESESESEDEAPKKAAAAKESSSEEESSSDEETDDDDDTKAKNASAVQARSKVTEAESASDDSSEDEDEGAVPGVDESMHMSDREDHGQVAKAKYFGNDFMMHRGDDGLKGKDLDKLCDQARQEGKQIWYFTVPADVPVSVIEKMTVPLAGQDQNVFSHNGDSFAASFETMLPRTDISINIPSKNTIRGGSRSADRVMHVKRVTNFSNAAVTAPSQGRPARPQPHGLKARFQPLGVQSSMGSIGAGSDDEREIEMTDAPALPASPPASSAKKSSKSSSKRRSSAGEGESSKKQKTKDDTPSSSRKSKKSKTAVEASPVPAPAPAPATGEARSTPVPLPPRLGAVPATKVPVPPVSSGELPGTPTPKNGKKESKSKKKSETPVLLPTSSQASAVPKKVTPVPAPTIPGR